jgi:hypothetical protein
MGCDMAELIWVYGEKGPQALLAALQELKNYQGKMGSLSAVDGQIEFPLYPVEVSGEGLEVLSETAPN